MPTAPLPGPHRVGWIGTGRMGFPMAQRLAKAGCDIAVWNRTRAKAEPLAAAGATVVDTPAALADRDIVFTMVSTSHDLEEVVGGAHGLLSRAGHAPKVLVDCSTVSAEASAAVRAAMARAGGAMLAAPVSGNAKVVKAGRLSIVASGPAQAYALAEPYLAAVGEGVSYVGDGELARIVKICHNVLLGVVSQSLAEITVLAERAGVPRHAFLDFVNKSVMGSTFTPVLLRKDLDLGLAAAHELGVPMPLAAATREIVQSLIGAGYADEDFMRLLTLEARGAGVELKPERVDVSDGLEPK
jgi:3-hydroxyisobutyrate dehydrogenase-like beta-hydroxyacid dehydrogenase